MQTFYGSMLIFKNCIGNHEAMKGPKKGEIL